MKRDRAEVGSSEGEWTDDESSDEDDPNMPEECNAKEGNAGIKLFLA